MTEKVLYVIFFIQIFSFDGCFSQRPEKNVICPVCPLGEVCVDAELKCTNPPCGTRPTCVCNIKCPYGYKIDDCKCRNPCQDVICPSDQYCSVQMEKPVCISRNCLDGALPQLDSDTNLIKCILPLEPSLPIA